MKAATKVAASHPNSTISSRLQMRVRLTTHSPLLPLKAWYGISPHLQNQDVLELKIDIVAGLTSTFGDEALKDIRFEIDGFQLLEGSMVESVIKDGDLVE